VSEEYLRFEQDSLQEKIASGYVMDLFTRNGMKMDEVYTHTSTHTHSLSLSLSLTHTHMDWSAKDVCCACLLRERDAKDDKPCIERDCQSHISYI
jgi:hypothetical protein